MEIYSANEYWVKGASLFHTDTGGTVDLADHPMARLYFISSHQHGVGNGTTRGNCQQLGNPLNGFPVMRALFVAMDEWVTRGVEPPPSAIPTLAAGTLAKSTKQADVGFPSIPGVQYTGLKSTRYLLDYGPDFDKGIMSINPPPMQSPYFDNPANGKIYPTYVPTTDADGNDVAGIRLPDVVVPVATYTGWSLRAPANGGPDGCEGSGQMIPFAATKAARLASGDPRLSMEERHPNFSAYLFHRVNAINHLASRRLLLSDDAQTELTRGIQQVVSGNLIPKGLENAED